MQVNPCVLLKEKAKQPASYWLNKFNMQKYEEKELMRKSKVVERRSVGQKYTHNSGATRNLENKPHYIDNQNDPTE